MSNKKIQSALISVFYKDGLDELVRTLNSQGVTIYSTGGTQQFIEKLAIPVVPAESLTNYPSILGGRVKTLHPVVFGGILGKRADEVHRQEMQQYNIPEIDLVIVDLYPFEETVKQVQSADFKGTAEEAEAAIIEKIDIGGPSMLRAAAKNHIDVVVIAAKSDYAVLNELLLQQDGTTTYDQRRTFAIKAFDVCTAYDTAISNYFHQTNIPSAFGQPNQVLRYGENPHQSAAYYGNLSALFTQLNGKELSYNNLVDVDAALQLVSEFSSAENDYLFAIIKHTNVCGAAQRATVKESWDAALAGDPESAFGGVLVCNGVIDKATAEAIQEIFFEVLIAPGFQEDALPVLKTKKNRILLQWKELPAYKAQVKSVLNGLLVQDTDEGNYKEWKEVGGRYSSEQEKQDLAFGNILCKHLKSNAIALVKNRQLIGKGCGQTSRIDSLRQSIEKAGQFQFDLNGAVLASDAFFPFDDCVKMGHAAGITAFIQPGGSVRDQDSITYCKDNQLVMVLTEQRHFKH
jgi:phosphoribosylaminoimidazolecarboxamide formyltransferase/IMP cyclohydrolase